MSEKPEIVPGEVDLDVEDVRDSRGRRIDAAYVERAVADVRLRRRGRPALDDDDETSLLSLRVPAQTRRRLDEHAAAAGRTRSDVVRDAIDSYLADQ